MLFQENQRIGNYTLIKLLGEGGFGEVWLAENRNNPSSEKVAIKLPRKEQIDLQAVKDEIFNWTLSGKHKNILPIIECETFGNQIAIVSEFAADGSLQDLIKKQGIFSVADAVEIIIGILDGLAHLHNRKIIHRDLKPDNILFQGEIPRLTDFGISRAMQIDSQSQTATGTLSYMSPEAFDGKRNAQTDIWSVGVILYQLLSGKLPFPQKTQIEFIGALVRKEPAPLPDSVPSDLQNIVKKSLAKEPSKRYQTAEEMCEALRNVLSPQKIAENQISSQAETLVLKDSDKTAKLEIVPVQEATLIIGNDERETEFRSVQTEIKTAAREQIKEKIEQIGKDDSNTKVLIQTGIGALLLMLLGVIVWVASSNTTNTTSTDSNSPNTFKNSIGIEFIKIPASSFMMGSPTSEKGRSDDEIQHWVSITNYFYIGKYEVTQAQWQAVMGSNPSTFKGNNLPVENVSWEDAQQFIAKLNAQSDGFKYRLPTEAEWEYAARAGTAVEYAGNIDAMAWYYSNSGNKTHEVGTKQANGWGLYDMHGNVLEWVQDRYSEYQTQNVTNPMEALNGSNRVYRGGYWNSPGTDSRSANRSDSAPSFYFHGLGFRVVRQ